MEQLLSTGEFAKICNVNKQTLMYYEDIDLFHPIYKNDKGFRFYSVRQFDLFTVIQLLKELGMPLQEIKSYMEQRSPKEFRLLLTKQKEIVQQKIAQLQQIQQIIYQKEIHYEAAETIDFDKITVQYMESRYLYLSENIRNANEQNFSNIVSSFLQELQMKHFQSGFPIGGLTLREDIEKQKFGNYSHLYMEQKNSSNDKSILKIKPGFYLIAYHIGDDQFIHEAYERIIKELNRLNMKMGDYIFEEYVFDAAVRSNIDEYVSKIMVHVMP